MNILVTILCLLCCEMKQYVIMDHRDKPIGVVATDCNRLWYKLWGENVIEVFAVEDVIEMPSSVFYRVENDHAEGWVSVGATYVRVNLLVNGEFHYDKIYSKK